MDTTYMEYEDKIRKNSLLFRELATKAERYEIENKLKLYPKPINEWTSWNYIEFEGDLGDVLSIAIYCYEQREQISTAAFHSSSGIYDYYYEIINPDINELPLIAFEIFDFVIEGGFESAIEAYIKGVPLEDIIA